MPKLDDPSYAWQGSMSKAQVVIDDKALVTMDYEHWRVHQAEMWYAHFINASVANGSSIDVLVSCSELTHMAMKIITEGFANVYLYEAPTYSGGTVITPVNRNREAALAGTAPAISFVIKHTPTVTGVGTELAHGLIAGGTNPSSAGGAGRVSDEWLLDGSTDYLIRATNGSGGAAYMEIAIDLYEDTHSYPGG